VGDLSHFGTLCKVPRQGADIRRQGEFPNGVVMEIGPVTGIRAVPMIKAPPADPGLSGVFDIENFARAGDETYTPSAGKSAGGREDEFDDPVEEDEAEAHTRIHEDGKGRKISIFA